MFWEYRGIFFTFSKIKHRAIIATSVELMQSVPSTEMKVLMGSPSDESINSEVMMPAGTESTKPSDHQMTGLQEMLTRGGCGDAAEMDINVTVFLGTGFQTSLEALNVHGISLLPFPLFIAPVQYAILFVGHFVQICLR
ncbi:hypothetical protein QTP88_018476 [Uroleucon formosanum]